MQQVTPFLWYNDNAEEAANFYVSIFNNSKIVNVANGQEGKPLLVTFELDGQQFMALNGGPEFKFTEAISLVISVDTQQEIDEYWEKLSEGGEKQKYGWLKDKYGLSWQVIPSFLEQWMNKGDPELQKRIIAAFEHMDKIDIETLNRAYEGK
ncbi:MAG: VOC family protein [Candidatus Omnitrophota bacterium]